MNQNEEQIVFPGQECSKCEKGKILINGRLPVNGKFPGEEVYRCYVCGEKFTREVNQNV